MLTLSGAPIPRTTSHSVWPSATAPVVAGLAVSIARDFYAGRLGVDAIALVSMSAELVLRRFRSANRVGVDHLHTEPARPPCHRAPDAPEADDPKRFPPHVAATELIQVPSRPLSRAAHLFALGHSLRAGPRTAFAIRIAS